MPALSTHAPLGFKPVQINGNVNSCNTYYSQATASIAEQCRDINIGSAQEREKCIVYIAVSYPCGL